MSDKEVMEPEEENEEGEQEAQGATETADVSKPEKAVSELKIVIILKADKAMMGVQSPDCDPVYKTMEGDLATVLQTVPALVADAKLQWAAAPRYPKADLPRPAAPPSTATIPAARKPAAAKTKETAQPKFF
ncbi:MAG: hypothetical protein HYX80_09630 [Chloroflexi bacterium]|nr:hypothetical protein [Chloroflexota bacterium]